VALAIAAVVDHLTPSRWPNAGKGEVLAAFAAHKGDVTEGHSH